MTVEKDGMFFHATCDFCGNYQETAEEDFVSAIEHIKMLGWRVFKKGQEWFHKCVACQDDRDGEDFEDVS